MVAYRIEPLTEAQADQVARWRYPAPYSVYDVGAAGAAGMLTPEYEYHGVGVDGELVGFCCFGVDAQVPVGRTAGWYEGDGLDVGLGLRPDRTGRGEGAAFLAAVLRFAEERYGAALVRLTVASFNARARSVYEAAGFVLVGESPDGTFLLLARRLDGGAGPAGDGRPGNGARTAGDGRPGVGHGHAGS
ncbi:MAG: GNAT family protein [Actinocatenispora sp.]